MDKSNGWLKAVVPVLAFLSLWTVLSSLYLAPRDDFSLDQPELMAGSKREEHTIIEESKEINISNTFEDSNVLETVDTSPKEDPENEVTAKESNMSTSQIAEPPVIEKNSLHSHEFDIVKASGEIDWTDRIFKRNGWDNDPIVIESHKLLFFATPKNACTTFKKLFRRMMGYEDWFTKSPHDPAKNGLKYLGHYSKQEQAEMMTSPEWTRAIFTRDPMERALSAYMDKALQPNVWTPSVNGAYLKRYCCYIYPGGKNSTSRNQICHKSPLSPYGTQMDVENFPFQTFVDKMMRDCGDPHWQPQSQRLGAASNWQFINFVGRFERRIEDTHNLLKRIEAFDEFGKSGWDKKNASLSIFETNTAPHKTGSSKKMDQHYTAQVRKSVFEYYRKDYDMELFNFTSPILE